MLVPLGSRGCIPVNFEGHARFAKWHSEIMKVVRGFVTIRLLGQHTQDIEEVYMYACVRSHLDSKLTIQQHKYDIVFIFCT